MCIRMYNFNFKRNKTKNNKTTTKNQNNNKKQEPKKKKREYLQNLTGCDGNLKNGEIVYLKKKKKKKSYAF